MAGERSCFSRHAFGLAQHLGNAYELHPDGSPYRSLQTEAGGHTRACGGYDDERADAVPRSNQTSLAFDSQQRPGLRSSVLLSHRVLARSTFTIKPGTR